jgi:protein-S-isoprenylcysteine O-methyltransferase Ste14
VTLTTPPAAREGLAPRIDLRDLVLGRAVPAALFGIVVVAEAVRLRDMVLAAVRPGATDADGLAALNSTLVLGYYCMLVGLYVVRLPQRGSDRRPLIALASFGGGFLVLLVPFLPAAPRRDELLLPADLLGLAGIICTVWSILHLRRSFSILPQARRLITSGPYGISRNPLYVGETVSSWAVFLPTLGWPGAVVLAVNVALQLIRVRAEERVLARTFGDEYAEYRRRVPRFVPHPWRR